MDSREFATKFIDEWLPGLSAIAMKFGDEETSQDLLQEAFVRGLEALSNPNRDEVKDGFQFSVDLIKHSAFDHAFLQQGLVPLGDNQHESAGPTIDIESAIQECLSPETADLVRERYFGHYSQEEIASRHGMTPSAVEWDVHRSCIRLSDYLQAIRKAG